MVSGLGVYLHSTFCILYSAVPESVAWTDGVVRAGGRSRSILRTESYDSADGVVRGEVRLWRLAGVNPLKSLQLFHVKHWG